MAYKHLSCIGGEPPKPYMTSVLNRCYWEGAGPAEGETKVSFVKTRKACRKGYEDRSSLRSCSAYKIVRSPYIWHPIFHVPSIVSIFRTFGYLWSCGVRLLRKHARGTGLFAPSGLISLGCNTVLCNWVSAMGACL